MSIMRMQGRTGNIILSSVCTFSVPHYTTTRVALEFLILGLASSEDISIGWIGISVFRLAGSDIPLFTSLSRLYFPYTFPLQDILSISNAFPERNRQIKNCLMLKRVQAMRFGNLPEGPDAFLAGRCCILCRSWDLECVKIIYWCARKLSVLIRQLFLLQNKET